MRFWRRGRSAEALTALPTQWPLSMPLFHVSGRDIITIADAMENIWGHWVG